MRACREASSPYVIQGVSATVRGQAKLMCEGEPQGDNRLAPEPPDTQARAWIRQVGECVQGMACDAVKAKVYISAPLQ